MKRSFTVWLLVGLAASGLAPQPSVAQGLQDILEHYRLIPRLSTLHQTGGIAGFNFRYRLSGEYDFDRGSVSNPMASFDDAEVWGSLISDAPTPAVVIDVDEILNLEGLKGTVLPVAAPFDVYRFRGFAADESSVELYAAVLGPWMYIRGDTQPPPGSADFFKYRLQALARSGRSADLNGDGVVDAADYVVLRDSGGAGSNDPTAGVGLAEWRQQFGEAIPDLTAMDAMMSAAVASFVTAAAVPEPSTLTMLLMATAVMTRVVQCSRRRSTVS